MMSKRYTYVSDQIHDKLTKKNLHGNKQTMDELNKIWEQTQRFEKYNNELINENKWLMQRKQLFHNKWYALREENKQLKEQLQNSEKQNEILKQIIGW